MSKGIVPIIGTLVLVLIGALIAFVLPRVITSQSGDAEEGDDLPQRWFRILGIALMVIGILMVIVVWALTPQ